MARQHGGPCELCPFMKTRLAIAYSKARITKREFCVDDSDSGPIALKILASLASGQDYVSLIRDAGSDWPVVDSHFDLEGVRLAQHLALADSNACTKKLLDLFASGTVNIFEQ